MFDVVFVLGPPGSGKGTQCERIVKEFGFKHLSAGELLRQEMDTPGSEHGEHIRNCLGNGIILEAEITCSLLKKAMQREVERRRSSGEGDTRGRFLIDGFPRTRENYEGWEKGFAHDCCVKFILFFTCPPEVSIERCTKRGEHGSGRNDDNVESLKKRLVVYERDTLPVIQFYDAKGLVRKIDGSRSVDEVYQSVEPLFKEFSSCQS